MCLSAWLAHLLYRLFAFQVYAPNAVVAVNGGDPLVVFLPPHPELLEVRTHGQLHALSGDLDLLVRTADLQKLKGLVLLVQLLQTDQNTTFNMIPQPYYPLDADFLHLHY